MVSKEQPDICEKYVFFSEIFVQQSGDEIGTTPLRELEQVAGRL